MQEGTTNLYRNINRKFAALQTSLPQNSQINEDFTKRHKALSDSQLYMECLGFSEKLSIMMIYLNTHIWITSPEKATSKNAHCYSLSHSHTCMHQMTVCQLASHGPPPDLPTIPPRNRSLHEHLTTYMYMLTHYVAHNLYAYKMWRTVWH